MERLARYTMSANSTLEGLDDFVSAIIKETTREDAEGDGGDDSLDDEDNKKTKKSKGDVADDD